MLKRIDAFLNALTMYRLVAYGLSLVAAVSIAMSLTDALTYPTKALIISLAVALASSYAANKTLARIWQVPTNNESWFITSMILFFIMPPASTTAKAGYMALAGVIAMASKYMIARNRTHIFNPAAFAAAFLGTAGLMGSAWWVGSSVLWPFTLFIGLLVVRKLRRGYLLLWFAAASLVVTLISAYMDNFGLYEMAKLAITASPLIFLGTIMLTEPSTMPSRKREQIIFAVMVGILFTLHWDIAGFYIYPEIALLIGNVYAYVVSPKYRLRMRLKEIVPVSARVSDYVFIPERKPEFVPGQYMEWTLPHHGQDDRGNRRTFTVASSPTEDEVHLGMKFYDPMSSFKRSLRAMKPGDSIYAGQLSGEFTLPADKEKPLAFIAGGIGITPFRSMLKYMIDTKQRRDIVLYYLLSDPAELAFKDILKQAEAYGVRVVTVTNSKDFGPADIRKITKDFKQRTFYISGPNAMVENLKKMLLGTGVPRAQIKADYFAGY